MKESHILASCTRAAMNLHRRAAERYFKAHNIQPEERTIDAHRLKSREAIRRTDSDSEIGIRDALMAGDRDTRLRVICGRGLRSERRIPVTVLILAFIGAMGQCISFLTSV
ncbi:hypothetical protein BJV78DRAFT_110853 [Lactifluus subvellereus]|nr:hypothetical protein BJV78DRAFT_110853 [Lactifluus subvellereus]